MIFSVTLKGEHDPLPQILFNTASPLTSGDSVEVPGGATLIYTNMHKARAKGAAEVTWILEILVDLGVAVSSGLLIAWLRDVIKKNPRKGYMINRETITDRTEFHLDEDKVRRIIYERTKELKQSE